MALLHAQTQRWSREQHEGPEYVGSSGAPQREQGVVRRLIGVEQHLGDAFQSRSICGCDVAILKGHLQLWEVYGIGRVLRTQVPYPLRLFVNRRSHASLDVTSSHSEGNTPDGELVGAMGDAAEAARHGERGRHGRPRHQHDQPP